MKKTYLVQLLALSLLVSTKGQAATTALQGLIPNTVNLQSTNLSIGYVFTVGSSDIEVVSLGYYDFDENGIEVLAEVAIFDSNGTTLASAFIPAGTPANTYVDNGYRFVSLSSPIILAANTSYIVAAQSGDVLGDTTFSNVLPIGGSPTLGSGIASAGNTVADGSPAPFVGPPSTPVGFDVYLGNVQYNLVPEPSSMLLILSLGGISLLRRSRPCR